MTEAIHVEPLLDEYAAAVPEVVLVAAQVYPVQDGVFQTPVDGITEATHVCPLLPL